MKNLTAPVGYGVLAVACAAAVVGAPSAAHAQQPQNLPPVTLDLRDAPIRSALEQLFSSAKVDYTLDNNVQGFVTMKVTEVPFETALKLIMRSASIPLTYTKENNIFIIRPRAVTTGAPGAGGLEAPPVVPDPGGAGSRQGVYPDQITLTYADPYDLQSLFGITILQTGQRQAAGGMGGMGMGGMGMGGMGMGGMGMGGMGMGGMGMGGMGMGGMGMGGMGMGGLGMGGMGMGGLGFGGGRGF